MEHGTEMKPIYPVEQWKITEENFTEENNYRNETTFSLSNGYIGTRGTFEEGYDFSVEKGLEGNFINGFYESEDIRYGEWNFGFPLKSQSLLNVANGKKVEIWLEDELFDMRKGDVWDYKRILHMDKGIVTRDLVYESPAGRRIKLHTERLVSFTEQEVMAVRIRVVPQNFSGTIRFVSILDGDVENHTRKTNPLVDYGPFGRRLIPEALKADEGTLYYEGHTLKSGLHMACGCSHVISGDVRQIENTVGEYKAKAEFTLEAKENQEIVMDKFIVYATSLQMKAQEMNRFVHKKLFCLRDMGYDELFLRQKQYTDDFWQHADIVIEGDDKLQQGLRFNLFHIMQSAGRDGTTGMGAKGLTGEGYEGHYFWDTEMYVIPVFVYTAPDLARKLLDYRFHTLEPARERARVLGHEKGALYPWRTINGEEASTYFPLGTAQYHINADIAYAFWLYITVTGDMEYLKEKGAEVLCETARVWADVGCFAKSRGSKYCICSVTGPDEYNAIVDNNFYTNLMARENLRDAVHALEWLKENDQGAYKNLMDKIGLAEEETEYWKKIIDHMYFPYDEERGIYPLDDGFMMRKPWDDSKIPPKKRHLLYENYHPLFVYRQRMSKQADAILGMYLHSNLFTEEELKRNYDFYQEVTLHHSSLSTCVFGNLACQIGRYEEAYEYFTQSARMDLDDYHHNFYAGIHAANMAGTWQSVANGFAGLRTNAGILEIHPHLPGHWSSYTLHISYRGSLVKIHITKERAECTLQNNVPVEIWINGICHTIGERGACIYEKI